MLCYVQSVRLVSKPNLRLSMLIDMSLRIVGSKNIEKRKRKRKEKKEGIQLRKSRKIRYLQRVYILNGLLNEK